MLLKKNHKIVVYIITMLTLQVLGKAQTNVTATCNNNGTPMDINDDFLVVNLLAPPNNCVGWQNGTQYVFPSNLSSNTDYKLYNAADGSEIVTGGGGVFWTATGLSGSSVAPTTFWIKHASGVGTAGGGNISLEYKVYATACPGFTYTIVDPGICSTPPPCSITISSITASSCNLSDNSYKINFNITYASPPSGEQIVFTLSNGTTYNFTPTKPTGGTEGVEIEGMSSNGALVTVNAAFSTTSSCSATAVSYTAPAQCYTPLCNASATTMGGRVFQDNNGDGQFNLGEVYAEGINVEVYSPNSTTPICTSTTNAAGEWACSGLTSGTKYRIEFSHPNISFYDPATTILATNTSATQFSTTNTCNVNYGVIDPSRVCDLSNLKAALPIMQNGTSAISSPSVIGFNYNGSGVNQVLASYTQTGTVWGMAYNRIKKTYFVGAAYRRHSGLGPLGTGGIYKIDMSNPASPVVSNYFTIANAGTDVHSGDLPTSGGTNTPSRDAASFAAVGKIALGDIELSEDGNTMYVVNLNTRSVVELDVTSAVPTVLNTYTIPNSACSVAGDIRPWGLKVYRGVVYVGIACSGETSGGAPSGIIYELTGNVGNKSFSATTINIDLTFNRQKAFDHACYSSSNPNYKAWKDTWPTSTCINPFGSGEDYVSYEQPIVGGIEFDEEGSMVVGIIDRFGFQSGFLNYSSNAGDNKFYVGISGGDVIRFCNINGTLLQEGVAGCPRTNPNEFYAGDFFQKTGFSGHQETSLGSLLYVPGEDVVGVVSYDPIDQGDFNAGGVRWLNNTTGLFVRGYNVYGNSGVSGSFGTFAKSNGLGDIEPACPLSKIQIGNLVWIDTNGNGIQDADETGLGNVSVSLYSEAGQFLSSTVTNNNGNYYFENIQPNSQYRVVFGFNGNSNTSQFTPATSALNIGGSDYYLTSANTGAGTNPDFNDSDAAKLSSTNTNINDYPTIQVVTVSNTKSNHRLDAGFALAPVVACNLAVTSITPTNVKCKGGTNGAADLTVAGAIGTPTYLWSNGATSEDLSAIGAGIYTITVSEGTCTATASATITEPTDITLDCTKTDVTTNGGTNGEASVNATGGTSPYSYLWSNMATSASITGLTAGTYTVTVTDANGCTSTCSSIVNEPGCNLSATAIGTNVKCNGGTDGTATVTPSGNLGAVTYLWSNAATSASITGLSAGTYTVTVTETASCTATASYTVTAPTALSLTCSKVDVTTTGGSNGQASVSASGGTTSYTYLWSNGATTSNITGLVAGTYTVTVTDANGCTSVCSSTVTEPGFVCNLTASAAVVSQPTCANNDGVVNLTVAGAVGLPTYLWSNGATTEDLTGLSSGDYTVTVTDGACTATATVSLAVVPMNIVYEICPGESYTLEVTNTSLTGLQWQKDGVDIPGAIGFIYTATSVGIYTYTSNNVGGCSVGQCCPIEIKLSANCCKPVICLPAKITRH